MGTTHAEIYVFFAVFAIVAFALLVFTSRSIWSNYYAQIQASTPPTVVQSISAAPPLPPLAPDKFQGV